MGIQAAHLAGQKPHYIRVRCALYECMSGGQVLLPLALHSLRAGAHDRVGSDSRRLVPRDEVALSLDFGPFFWSRGKKKPQVSIQDDGTDSRFSSATPGSPINRWG